MDAQEYIQYTLSRLESKRIELEDAKREALRAYERVNTIAGDIEGYERWLEAETRGTDSPYFRRQPTVVQFPGFDVEHRMPRRPTAPPKVTNTGILYDVIKSQPGITVGAMHNAIPEGAPRKLNKTQVYAAVSKLVEQRKVYKKDGGYYPLDDAIKESEATG